MTSSSSFDNDLEAGVVASSPPNERTWSARSKPSESHSKTLSLVIATDEKIASSIRSDSSVETDAGTKAAPVNSVDSSVESIPEDAGPLGKTFALPPKSGRPWLRNLRFLLLTTYRRLFTIIFTANIAVLIGLAATKGLNYSNTATAASVNLVVSILMRQEHVINLLFLLSSSLPTSWPLWIRIRVAKIYCYGGVHSGCGIAAAAWYFALTAYLTQGSIDGSIPWHVAALSYAILALFLLIVGFAHPAVRMKMHNNFEMTHRFAGWTIVAIFWAQVILLIEFERQKIQGGKTFANILINTPSFWCLDIITACIFYPWIRLRRRAVWVEKLSDHATRIHFTHGNVNRCIGIRISTNPLFEAHSFATIPAARPDKGFSVVISNAGDWTRGIIRENMVRTRIWTKGAPVYGVLRTALVFKRTVLVATGSGIGPLLSLINNNDNIDCRVLWSTKDPIATYGQEIVNAVRAADPNAVIYDTKNGRPNLLEMAYNLWKQSGAEAVFLISNPIVTRKLIYGLESRAVPAFAPIFDS